MTDAKHLLVAGPSGGGKTTYLREQHARHDGPSIFLTTKKNERKAASDPPLRIRKSSCSYPDDIEQARQWALERNERVQVIVDEAQNAPTFADGADGPLRTGLHEDRSRGVRYVVATQNPQDLHTTQFKYGPVQQCEYWVFCGPLKDWHVGFLSGNNMKDLQPYMPTENYEYVVIRPTASLPPEKKIQFRGETDPRYS